MKSIYSLLKASLVAALWFHLGVTAQADIRKVALAKTPAAVRETINRAAAGAKINSIARRAESGEVTFEVSVQRKSGEREFTVADDGYLLSMEVGLEEVPLPARSNIQRILGANKPERIDKITENGEPIFEVSFGQSGHSREFTVSEEGVTTRFEIEYNELPRAIRAAVEKHIATNQLERVDRTFDDGEMNYDVQFTTNGLTRVLTVGTNGIVSRIEISLSDTPAAVQRAIQARLKGWKLGDIDKVLDEDEVTYDVGIKKGRVTREFTLDMAGKLLSETIDLDQAPPAVRQTIVAKIGSGRLLRVERNYEEDGTVSFDVEAKRDGKSFDFNIGSDGKLLGDN